MDSDGLNTYKNAILNGSPESNIDNTLLCSEEHQMLFIRRCYAIFLGRNTGDDEVGKWKKCSKIMEISNDGKL